jgi:hypothetical protein
MSRTNVLSFDTLFAYTRSLLVLDAHGVRFTPNNATGMVFFEGGATEILDDLAQALSIDDAEQRPDVPSTPPAPLDALDEFLMNAPVSDTNLALWGLLLFDKIEQRLVQVGGSPALVYVQTGSVPEIDSARPRIKNVAARTLLSLLADQRVGFVIGNHENSANIGWHTLDPQTEPSATSSSNIGPRSNEAWSELAVGILLHLSDHPNKRGLRLSQIARGLGCDDMDRLQSTHLWLVRTGDVEVSAEPKPSPFATKKRTSGSGKRRSRDSTTSR